MNAHRSIRPLFLASMLAFFCADAASAQNMPPGRPEILLSKGLTIHRIDDPTAPPSTFNQIRDDKNIVPVAAGKLLIRFTRHAPLRSAGARRHMVLTEDGVWGYLKQDDRLYEAEPRLRRIAASDAAYAIITHEFRGQDDAGVDYVLGRGEVYEIAETPDDVAGGLHYRLRLPDDKLADLRARAQDQGIDGVELELTAPKEHVEMIDLFRILPQGVEFDEARTNTRQDYEKIYDAWKKFEIEPSAQFVKVCGEKADTVTVDEVSGAISFSAGIDLEAAWNVISATLGLSGEAAKKYKSEVTRATLIGPEKSIRSSTWLFKAETQEKTYFISIVGDCAQARYWHQIETPDRGRVDMSESGIDAAFADASGITFEPTAGHIVLNCYADDFLNASIGLKERFNLEDHEAFFILSRIARIKDWRRFFSC